MKELTFKESLELVVSIYKETKYQLNESKKENEKLKEKINNIKLITGFDSFYKDLNKDGLILLIESVNKETE